MRWRNKTSGTRHFKKKKKEKKKEKKKKKKKEQKKKKKKEEEEEEEEKKKKKEKEDEEEEKKKKKKKIGGAGGAGGGRKEEEEELVMFWSLTPRQPNSHLREERKKMNMTVMILETTNKQCPNFKGELHVLAAPVVQLRVVGAQFLEPLPGDSEQAARHCG